MSNRLVRRRKALIAVGCVFCLAAILLIPGAQAAGVSWQITASGDRIAVAGDVSWIAGTQDLTTVPPLQCAGEILIGSASTRLLSRGGTYQNAGSMDNTEIMIYQQQSEAAGINGVYRDSLHAAGYGSPWVESVCGPMPEEAAAATAYCSRASFSTLAMGDNLNIQSQGAIVQADAEQPDSMAAQVLVTGNGVARLQFESLNSVGIGSTPALGYTNTLSQRVSAAGSQMQAGMTFQWSSFANMWPDEPVVVEE